MDLNGNHIGPTKKIKVSYGEHTPMLQFNPFLTKKENRYLTRKQEEVATNCGDLDKYAEETVIDLKELVKDLKFVYK